MTFSNKSQVENLDIVIAQQCNLRCSGCVTFSDSPKVKGTNTVIEGREWLEHWTQYVEPRNVFLFGGEPLLNPELYEWMKMVREYFPHQDIIIQTNGTRLHQFPMLYQYMKDYKIGMKISQHTDNPTHKKVIWDFINNCLADSEWVLTDKSGWGDDRGWKSKEGIYLQLSEYWRETVWWDFYKNTAEESKPQFSFDDTDYKTSWENCSSRTFVNLVNGKLYKCPAIGGLLENGSQILLQPEWNDWLKYKPLEMSANETDIREWFDNQASPENICNMCVREQELTHQRY